MELNVEKQSKELNVILEAFSVFLRVPLALTFTGYSLAVCTLSLL